MYPMPLMPLMPRKQLMLVMPRMPDMPRMHSPHAAQAVYSTHAWHAMHATHACHACYICRGCCAQQALALCTKEERFAHLEELAADSDCQLDFATIDPGAVNFGRIDPESGTWVDDFVMSVSHEEARHFFGICARHGIRWSATVREVQPAL